MKSLNEKQIKRLRKFGYDTKAIENFCKLPLAESLTIVDGDGFIFDLKPNGRLAPRGHNLEEDLKKKDIESVCLVSGDGRL